MPRGIPSVRVLLDADSRADILRVLARTGRAGGRRSYASFPPSPGSIAMSTLGVARRRGAYDLFEWLCTKERWNLEVAIMFGTAARYRRAAVRRSYDDAHPDNPTLHKGVRPHPGFVVSLYFITSRTGNRTQVFEMLPAFSCISWACAFAGGGGASIFFSGLVGTDKRHSCPVSTSWPFWSLMVHPRLGEEDSTSPPLVLNRSAHRRTERG
jgi:hypothetical protein